MTNLLGKLGLWLVKRYAPERLPRLINPSAPRFPRFYVGLTLYDGDEGGSARRHFELAREMGMPEVGVVEFWDGLDCRGRWPE